jgi:hypothetical protein
MAVPLTVALHPAVAPHAPEVKYVFRTLLRLAGYAHRFVWAGAEAADIYYGPAEPSTAKVQFAFAGLPFGDAAAAEPRAVREHEGLPLLEFAGETASIERLPAGKLRFTSDLVFACYWLLTGAREPSYQPDRWGNLSLAGSFFLANKLLERPVVSLYACALREHFAQIGRQPLPPPWEGKQAAFAFTHDVDYPQIIRWIECLRLFLGRGSKAWPSIRGVLDGSNHFWKFSEWVNWLKELGARPAFYFAAERGSLLRYAAGTPDVFYDVRTPEFRELFRYLRANRCEVGLHASFLSHQHEGRFFHEKQMLEEVLGGPVDGNRNHYWHLDPAAPNDTLRMHEQVGFLYDTSLAFEFYPGFRRAICHPFRPFHPGERRELDILQIPPTWMDDHFDRRLAVNGITDPEACAAGLLDHVRATGGVAVVDYHARGMNEDFYPRYGRWLQEFARRHLDSSLAFLTPREVARAYLRYEKALQQDSQDRTAEVAPARVQPASEVGPMIAADAPHVAQLHYLLFGDAVHGYSIATFGPRFLERAFYLPNLENPHFHCDVVRHHGQAIGFIAYTTRRDALRFLLGRPLPGVALEAVRTLLLRPSLLLAMLGNLRYLGGDKTVGSEVDALWLVVGVHPRYRTVQAERKLGFSVAGKLFESMEQTMRAHGCNGWCAGMRTGNPAIKLFVEMRGARLVGTVRAQGVLMDQYVKMLAPSEESP